ncbi:MAG TPA: hypothetical protein VE135_07555 [Pyrinomonadaceae bacterium]|nr:hypothetical protein [Pyrinomonadaceae bacterium]
MARDGTSRVGELYNRLREVELKLQRELRARGFEPGQLETTALPGALALLSAERNEIQRELEEIEAEERNQEQRVSNERTEEN